MITEAQLLADIVLVHALDQTADAARRIALRAVEMPLCKPQEPVQ